jgi:hypothetical protein
MLSIILAALIIAALGALFWYVNKRFEKSYSEKCWRELEEKHRDRTKLKQEIISEILKNGKANYEAVQEET